MPTPPFWIKWLPRLLSLLKVPPPIYSCHIGYAYWGITTNKWIATTDRFKCLEPCLTLEIKRFICHEEKYGKVKRAGSCQESNQGHLACAASALPLSYIWQLSNHKPSQQLFVLQDSKHLEWEEKINKKHCSNVFSQMCSLRIARF